MKQSSDWAIFYRSCDGIACGFSIDTIIARRFFTKCIIHTGLWLHAIIHPYNYSKSSIHRHVTDISTRQILSVYRGCEEAGKKNKKSGQAKLWRRIEFGVISRGDISTFDCSPKLRSQISKPLGTRRNGPNSPDFHKYKTRLIEQRICQNNYANNPIIV